MISKEKQLIIGRRNALKMLGLSSAAMLSGGFNDTSAAEPRDINPDSQLLIDSGKSSVAFTTGTDRQQMLFEVIKPFEQEIRAARAWVIANPKKKKSQWHRFLTGWLSRAQERGGSLKSNRPQKGGHCW